MFDGLLPGLEHIDVSGMDQARPGDWQDRKVTITVYP
jgi:hypothetical protein